MSKAKDYIVLIIILVLGAWALLTWAGMALWNSILVNLINVNPIGYWQFLGLQVLVFLIAPRVNVNK